VAADHAAVTQTAATTPASTVCCWGACRKGPSETNSA
jgi:hypothetical protein